MPSVTLKAHYDGERILLDEPFEIPPNSAPYGDRSFRNRGRLR